MSRQNAGKALQLHGSQDLQALLQNNEIMRKWIFALVTTISVWAQGVPAEMCGTWSYLSGGQGSYMSTRTLTLNANGTYSYYSESQSSGGAGSAYGNNQDSGTWYVQGNVIIAQSQNEGLMQLPFSMYPNQNGDIVLEIDGDVYVR